MAAQTRTNAGLAVGQGFVGFGLVAIGVAGSLATLLGFFGSTWWLFDFAANFRAHIAVVLLLVALVFFGLCAYTAKHHPKFALLAASVVVLGLGLLCTRLGRDGVILGVMLILTAIGLFIYSILA